MHIDKIGVELEGFYTNESINTRIDRRSLVEHWDGSYRTTRPGVVPKEYIPVEPFTSDTEGREKLKNWLKTNYPDYTNFQCGFHVHISLKNPEHYRLLMTEEFYNFYLQKYELWGKLNRVPKNALFWKRLEGKRLGKRRNRTCYAKKGFNIKNVTAQLSSSGDRYYHLNFAYEKHRTLESRMLPMFKTPELAYSAVIEFTRIVEAYINQTPNTESSLHKLREMIEVEEREELEEVLV